MILTIKEFTINSIAKKQITQLKMGKGPEQTFSQIRHTNGQQIYKKMLNITNHRGNANQNHSKISPHTC